MSEIAFDFYLEYTAVDLILDEKFQEWVLTPTPDNDAYWQALVVALPQKQKTIGDAKEMLRAIKVTGWQHVPEGRIRQSFAGVARRLHSRPAPTVVTWRPNWWAAAASVLVLSFLGVYWYGFKPQRIATSGGQSKTIKLADNSVVILGANSRIDIPGKWSFALGRDVQLSGEAYFEVQKRRLRTHDQVLWQSFSVQTELLNIRVLGTCFHVNTRRGQASVQLDEGKVSLTENKTSLSAPVLLHPHETATVRKAGNGIQIAKTETINCVTSWKNNALVCSETPLHELSLRFNEVYGISLLFVGNGWQDELFTGTLPLQHRKLALNILSESFSCRLTTDDQQIKLFKNESPTSESAP